jgi:hypothetical protein
LQHAIKVRKLALVNLRTGSLDFNFDCTQKLHQEAETLTGVDWGSDCPIEQELSDFAACGVAFFIFGAVEDGGSYFVGQAAATPQVIHEANRIELRGSARP